MAITTALPCLKRLKSSDETAESASRETENNSAISDAESVDLLAEDRPYHLLQASNYSQDLN